MNNWIKIKTFIAVSIGVLMLASVANATESVTYLHHDHLGSPAAATDEAGNILWTEEYFPYGERIKQEAASEENNLWYTGKHHDNKTGLTYFLARWYDPVVGRFMAIDPVGFDSKNQHSFNRYAYANNNPYRFVDPDGNIPVDTVWDLGNVIYDVLTGDNEALAVDLAALAIPYMPAGITKLSKLRGVDDVTKELKYAPRVRARGVEDPKSHNFPYSFDKEILKAKPDIKNNGYKIYRKEGTMTGKTVTDPKTGIRTQQYKNGVYEIGVRKDGVIDHRFFRSTN